MHVFDYVEHFNRHRLNHVVTLLPFSMPQDVVMEVLVEKTHHEMSAAVLNVVQLIPGCEFEARRRALAMVSHEEALVEYFVLARQVKLDGEQGAVGNSAVLADDAFAAFS